MALLILPTGKLHVYTCTYELLDGHLYIIMSLIIFFSKNFLNSEKLSSLCLLSKNIFFSFQVVRLADNSQNLQTKVGWNYAPVINTGVSGNWPN